MQKRFHTVFSGWVGVTAICAGQESSPDLAETSLEQLGNIKVYTASRHLQAAEDAPSSVSVITADEIQRYGYRTLLFLREHRCDEIQGFYFSRPLTLDG